MNEQHSDGHDALSAGLMVIWEEKRGIVLTRVSTIESAACGARCGSLTSATRRVGEYDAHKLAGLLGTFGFPAASELALEAEQLLRGEGTLSRESALRLLEIAVELRRQLSVENAA
jgi:Hpt domain-containing protein